MRGAPNPLTPGLVEALRELPDGDVVFSDLETSYRIAAAAPLYIAAAPPSHVADTNEEPPVRAAARQRSTSSPAATSRSRERYGADWLVVDRDRFDLLAGLPVVYRDERYTLYRLP